MTLEAQITTAFGGRLRIERELGGGGMSRVFLARESSPDRHVVVKVLPPDLLRDTGAARFRREIDVAGRLQHPNIVPILEVASGEGPLAYTMPYIDGHSLREKLSGGALAVGEALRIWRDILEALSYAHTQGVVHRDIKPENILLSGRHAVLTDFGIARAVSEATSSERMTSTGLALGTPAYMAPEQVAADPRVDHRADLYAAGVIMWEMLVGRHPFAGFSPAQMMIAHATRVPEPLATARPSTPASLAALVASCLAKEPADRPESAGQVLAQLELETIGSTPDGTAVRGAAPTAEGASSASPAGAQRRRPTALLVGAALVLTIAGIAAWQRFGRERTPAPADAAAAAANRRGVIVIPLRGIDRSSPEGRAVMQLAAGELERLEGADLLIPDPAFVDLAQRLMGWSPETATNPDTLRMFGESIGMSAAIELDLVALGSSYSVSASVYQVTSGRPIGQFTEAAKSPDELLDAARRLGTEVRNRLADSLPFMEAPPARGPLSTRIAGASDQIRRGFRAFQNGDLIAATEHFRIGVQLDPGFAMGYRQIAIALFSLGLHRSERVAAAERSFALRDSVRPFERAQIIGARYSILGLRDSGIAFYMSQRQGAQLDPNAANNLAVLTSWKRQFPLSEQLYRESLGSGRTQPNVGHSNLALTTLAMGKLGVVDSLFRETPALVTSSRGAGMRRLESIALRRYSTLAGELDATTPPDSSPDRQLSALRRRFTVAAVLGRVQEAATANRAAEALVAEVGATGDALREALLRVRLNALLDVDQAQAAAEYTRLLSRYDVSQMHPLDRPYVALAATATALGKLADAERWIAAYRREMPKQYQHLDWHAVQAEESRLAAARGDGAAAVRFAIAADSGECVACTQPTLALAYRAAGDVNAEARAWQRFLQQTSPGRDAVDRFELARALRTLGERADAQGDTQTALKHFDELLGLWANADPDLQAWLAPVKSRVAALRNRPG